MAKKTFLLLSVLFLGRAGAQDNPISKIAISSPTAASLGKYGDIPVSYHTGIPNVGIPLYTISAGPLSIPVSLSYHASGLKVQEPAGWVGAGWSLNAGGVITRSVMGAPDEKGTNNGQTQTGGHFSDYGYNSYLYQAGQQDWQAFAKGFKDGEPDLYFFNFGGYSGKFYFRDDRTPVCVPEQDLRIVPYYDETGNQSIQGFTVTTPDGAQYSFGNTPGVTGAVEITRPVTANNGLSTANTISSWYLNRVASADAQFTINLYYQAENYGYFIVSMFPIDGVPSGSVSSSTTGYDLVKNVVQGVRLDHITFPNGTVSFVAGAVRTDLGDATGVLGSDYVNTDARALGSVQVKNSDQSFCKSFNFSYGYFTDNTTPLQGTLAQVYPNLQTDETRLRLDQVQEASCDNSASVPPYTFTYIAGLVQRRLGFGIDHWGFNNGATGNAGLIPAYTVDGGNGPVTFPGASRDAAWPEMAAGTLGQINYPTGGSTSFGFGSNQAYVTKTTYGFNYATQLNLNYHGQADSGPQNFTVTGNSGVTVPVKIHAYNYSAQWTPDLSIKNSSGVEQMNGTQTNTSIVDLQLLPGVYTARITFPPGYIAAEQGGAFVQIYIYGSSSTTSNTTIGGLRIESITNHDGIDPANDVTTSYSYNSGSQSSAILYGRPVYVGIVRNDLVASVGYYQPGSGFQPYISLNGCPTVPNAEYFKSPSSIRPMASTQGYPIGYSQVKVSQTGNGYSIYQYYGTSPWQLAPGDVAVTSVATAGCDANAANYPTEPLPFEYIRGELKHEAHYNQAGQILKEVSYNPSYMSSTTQTPAFMAVYQGAGTRILGTNYSLISKHKTQTVTTETDYEPGGNGVTTTTTSYNESPWHHNVTRTTSKNSLGEILQSKQLYAQDFRVAACDAIAGGYPQYTTDCNNCLTARYTAMGQCATNDGPCLSAAYLAYQQCLATARTTYVAYQRSHFTDATNAFKTAHDAAKASAGTELKPILELQDGFRNPVIESTRWRDNNLLGATFTRYDYMSSPANIPYPQEQQLVNVAAPSASFSAAVVSGNTITKDGRYIDESSYLFDNGNLVQLTAKDGVATSYLWGYSNSLPMAKAEGARYASLSAAYSAAGGNLSQLAGQSQLLGALVSTYSHMPLVGMTGQTDPAGHSGSFEYDPLGRFTVARDQYGNITKQNGYGYGVATSTASPVQAAGILAGNVGSGGPYTLSLTSLTTGKVYGFSVTANGSIGNVPQDYYNVVLYATNYTSNHTFSVNGLVQSGIQVANYANIYFPASGSTVSIYTYQ